MSKRVNGNRNKDKQIKKEKTMKTEQIDNHKKGNFKYIPEYVLLAVMVIAITILLFISPFQRGLFFPEELLTAKTAIFGLLIVWGLFRLWKREDLRLNSPLDICIVVLVLAYLISFFVAVNEREALTEVLKTISYLIVYLVTIDICRYFNPPWLKVKLQNEQGEAGNVVPPGLSVILHLLLTSAVVVAIASLGVAAGNWEFIGAYEDGRIASPIAYANAAAAYFMAAYFLAVALIPLAGKWVRPVYLAAATLLLMTLILTFSRGAWLLLPPLGLLLVLASAPCERIRSFLNLFFSTLAAVPIAFITDSLFQSEVPGRAWPMIIIAIILAVLLGLLVEYFINQNKRVQLILAGAGIALMIVVIFISLLRPVLAPIHLERTVEEPAEVQTIQQVISKVNAGETYQLSLEVNAELELPAGFEKPDYVWGILVLGGLLSYEYNELLNYRGESTEGWQKVVFTFQTTEDVTRLVINLFNEHPGTSFTVRSVILSSEGKQQELGFALNRMLPPRFYNRLFSFSREINMERRFELFRDAVKVIKDYPILGIGGGGWAAVFHVYQEQLYYSREVHNHYLQVWVEAGIFGFLAFVGIWISFAAAFIRNCLRGRASPRVWQFWTSSFVPVAALGAHSFIDWNFSMAAVGIYLFVLLGAGRSMDRAKWFNRPAIKEISSNHSGLITGIIAVFLGLSLLVYAIMLLIGLNTTWRSQELIERNSLKQAVLEMEKAIRLDPLLSDNYYNLSVLIEENYLRSGNPDELQRTLSLAKRAHKLEPYDLSYTVHYGVLLLNHVNIEEGLNYIDRAIMLNRFISISYLQPAISRLRISEFYLETGNRRDAERYLNEVLGLEQLMIENTADSRTLFFAFGRANQLLRNFAAAIKYYEAVPAEDQFYNLSQQFLAEILGDD